MSSRLGRNPFEAKATKAVREQKPLPAKAAASAAAKSGGFLGWALVDVPAETYVFGLKLVMLARNTWDGKRGREKQREDAARGAPPS